MGNATLTISAVDAIQAEIATLLAELGGNVRFESYDTKKGILNLVQRYRGKRTSAERANELERIAEFFAGREIQCRHSVAHCGVLVSIRL